MGWHKKKGCYLLSSYKKIQNKKGWTAGYVADSPSPSPSPGPSPPYPSPSPSPSPSPTPPSPPGTCTPRISKNKAYKYVKSALMSKPTKTKNVQDCLKACTGA